MTHSSDVPTLTGVAGIDEARRARSWRRVGVVLLTVIVALSCLGWLGPREATASDGDLTVMYPQVTRSGSDSALTITAKGVGGAPVTVEIPQTAFDRLGLESIRPAPATETPGGGTVRLTFEAPQADELSVDLAGRLGTRSDLGPFSYEIRVSTEGRAPLVVRVRTWVLP